VSFRTQWLAALLATISLLLLPSSGFAQASASRFSVSGGFSWTGGSNIGARDANETTSGGGSYRLFASDTELGGAACVEATLSARLSRLLHAEVIVSYGQLNLRTRLSSDVEGIADTEASESIGQLTLEGAARVDLPAWQLPRQTMPFLTAGGGYLRHLHEGRMFVETGTIFHAGGGLITPLGSAAAADASSAIRFDVTAMIRNGGAIPDDGPHVSPSVAASFVWNF
jgi:hypothetical protein